MIKVVTVATKIQIIICLSLIKCIKYPKTKLPFIVAKTEVGKKVKVKIWRNKKEITKTIVLGRLETSEAGYKAQKEQQNKEIELTSKNISSIKISVKPLTSLFLFNLLIVL